MKISYALLLTGTALCLISAAYAQQVRAPRSPLAPGVQTIEPSAGDATATDVTLNPAQLRSLQQALNSRGYEPGPPGFVTGQLEDALRDFQSDNNIDRTGTITSQTLAALGLDFGLGTNFEGQERNPPVVTNRGRGANNSTGTTGAEAGGGATPRVGNNGASPDNP